MNNVLSCKRLSKVYDEGKRRVSVLDSIDLDVAPAECVTVVGASGSGKSTLLHLLGGLDSPSAGQIQVLGRDLATMSEADRGVWRNQKLGFVYQFHHLLPEFTARENVMMPLLIRRVPAREAAREANALLSRVGLEERAEHKPGELSGGERQRVAIVRALVTRPACVLADEPTGNLDYRTAHSVFNLMRELNQQFNASLLIVTHDRKLASQADRVLRLVDGILEPVSPSTL